MSFTDDIKRSLGFEESERDPRDGPNIVDRVVEFTKSQFDNKQQKPAQQQYTPKSQQGQRPVHNQSQVHNQRPQQKPVYDDFEFIVPEQSLYDIVLIRPKTLDDINYVVDQVIGENNPVIMDLSFLEKESPANFKLAGDKIKQMRLNHNAQALLLARSGEKNLIIVSPKKVAIKNKG